MCLCFLNYIPPRKHDILVKERIQNKLAKWRSSLFVFKGWKWAHSKLRNHFYNEEDEQNTKSIVQVILCTFLNFWYSHIICAGSVFATYFQSVAQLDISATSIRNMIEKGMNPSFLLPENVIEYIKENKLYSYSKVHDMT